MPSPNRRQDAAYLSPARPSDVRAASSRTTQSVPFAAMPGHDTRLNLAIGVLTFRRPELLAVLLDELGQVIGDSSDLVVVSIIVVDNDPDASARSLAETRPGVRYVVEPTPGIAAARQRCLTEAAGFDLLQFIDDDELPEPGWLDHMVQTWLGYGRPAAVAGSVLPKYAEPPDSWLLAGGFFDRRRPPTGTELPAAPAGNLMIDVAWVRRLGVQFDHRLGLRGGEDTLFTSQLVSRGGRIVFCREAAVLDLVPPERATRQWVLRRAWHHGATATYLDLLQATTPMQRLQVRCRRVIGGGGRWLAGAAKAAWGTIRRAEAVQARGLRVRQRGAGMARAALGPVPQEYQR